MANSADTVFYDECATCWHLMVRTEGGEVSMLQNLDAPTARKAYQRLQPETRPVEYLNMPERSFSMGWRTIHKSDIRTVDIIGPDGADLDPWRNVPPRVVDLTPERQKQEAAEKRARENREKANDMAAKFGVIVELRPELSECGFRCASCNKMQPANSLLYYLPDGLRKSDPVAVVKQQIEANKLNGHSSGWCASCAPKEPSSVEGRVSWWRRLTA